MPRNRPEPGASLLPGDATLPTIGRVTTRLGAGVLLAAAPLAAGTLLAILLGSPTLDAGLRTALAAATGPLGAGGGLPWLFHAAVLGLLAGCWLLGFGLVLSGLSD